MSTVAKPIKPGTQAELVLKVLSLGPLTSIEAFTDFGITRLAARIKELRDAGHKIETEFCRTTNRLGGSCNYASYRLVV